MSKKPLFSYLFCLGALLLAACAPNPEPAAPVVVTRATTQAVVALTDTARPTPPIPLPSTEAPPAVPTLTPTRPTTTPTAYQSPTATATATIRPTFTPAPGPVWPIAFDAKVCSAPSLCSDMSSEPQNIYLINSDGSDLRPMRDLVALPAEIPAIHYLRLSPDGTQLAYLVWPELFLANADGSHPVFLTTIAEGFNSFDFLPETGCLAIYNERLAEKQLIIEKSCAGSPEPEVLDIVTFADVEYLSAFRYQLSPQGDKLLAYGTDIGHFSSLYVYEMGSGKPPHPVFYWPPPCTNPAVDSNSAKWLPDGKSIEFLLITVCHNDQIATTFYTVDWQGEELITRLSFEQRYISGSSHPIWTGDWLPNGHEFVFTYWQGLTGDKSGLYILDFDTGETRQILPEFYVTQLRVWSPVVFEPGNP